MDSLWNCVKRALMDDQGCCPASLKASRNSDGVESTWMDLDVRFSWLRGERMDSDGTTDRDGLDAGILQIATRCSANAAELFTFYNLKLIIASLNRFLSRD